MNIQVQEDSRISEKEEEEETPEKKLRELDVDEKKEIFNYVLGHQEIDSRDLRP